VRQAAWSGRVTGVMRSRAATIGLLVLASAQAGCAAPDAGRPAAAETGTGGSSVRYVALGDSYTIGTSVTEAERWPNQLVERVERLELVGNPAVNGYTSLDLINEELPKLEVTQPELVSVLIGVNDVVQGVPDAQYAGNVAVILEELLTRLPSGRILCIATPDYTVTPSGGAFGDPMQQSDGIVRANAILREACESRGIRFVPEIFELSQAARDDRSLVADDGLHPSGAQYRQWVDVIAPVVKELIGS
jgi:lysophospholipase L1-like esterase